MTPGLSWFAGIFRLAWEVKERVVFTALVGMVLFDWFFGLVKKGFDFIKQSISESAAIISTFGNVSLSSIPGIGYVNAVIPLSEMVALLVTFYSLWLLIILIRWVKSFIPTIAN